MKVRKFFICGVAVCALVASSAYANSCSKTLVVKNHRPYAVTLSIKSFYGVDFERPSLFDFERETLVQGNGRFTRLDEAVIAPHSEITLPVRTLCPQGTEKRTHYVNWRYALPGAKEKSGQLELVGESPRIDVR